MKKYPAEAINQLTRHVLRDTSGFNWLIEHGYKELLATLDAVRDDREAFRFLLDNKQYATLAAFVNAVWDDDKALKFLLDLKQFEWAACANVINGDDSAEAFLKKAGKPEYIALAHAIQSRIHEDGDRMTTPIGVFRSLFNFKKLFKKHEDR
jgi:hypothetical protein